MRRYRAYTRRHSPSSKKGAHVAIPPQEEISMPGLMSQSKGLTSLTPTPAYIHNPPLGTTIPARTDLHFKFVLRDADRLESRFEDIIVRWHIFQRRNTLKVIQKANNNKFKSTGCGDENKLTSRSSPPI